MERTSCYAERGVKGWGLGTHAGLTDRISKVVGGGLRGAVLFQKKKVAVSPGTLEREGTGVPVEKLGTASVLIRARLTGQSAAHSADEGARLQKGWGTFFSSSARGAVGREA